MRRGKRKNKRRHMTSEGSEFFIIEKKGGKKEGRDVVAQEDKLK